MQPRASPRRKVRRRHRVRLQPDSKDNLPTAKAAPGGGGPGGPGGLEGTVTAISGSSYTIQDTRAQTTTETTVTLTETVKVRYLITDTAASLSDIVVGSNVQVRGRPGDNNTTSVEEVIILPAGNKVDGRVSAISGDYDHHQIARRYVVQHRHLVKHAIPQGDDKHQPVRCHHRYPGHSLWLAERQHANGHGRDRG